MEIMNRIVAAIKTNGVRHSLFFIIPLCLLTMADKGNPMNANEFSNSGVTIGDAFNGILKANDPFVQQKLQKEICAKTNCILSTGFNYNEVEEPVPKDGIKGGFQQPSYITGKLKSSSEQEATGNKNINQGLDINIPIVDRTKRTTTKEPQLRMNTTIGGTRKDRLTVASMTNLTVDFQECGLVFCYAFDVYLNQSIHRWDYHVEWSIPRHVKERVNSDHIFVLGNHFQMAHAYLVFRRFDQNYEGQYRCRLTLFDRVVREVFVNLVYSSTLSDKQCVLTNQ